MRAQDIQRDVVSFVYQLAYLCVDLEGDGVGVVRRRTPIFAEEDFPGLLTQGPRTDRVGHAVLGDHLTRDLGGTLDVVARAGGDVVGDYLLGDTPAHQHGQFVAELLARHQELVVLG